MKQVGWFHSLLQSNNMKDSVERIMKCDSARMVQIILKVLNPNCAIASLIRVIN